MRTCHGIRERWFEWKLRFFVNNFMLIANVISENNECWENRTNLRHSTRTTRPSIAITEMDQVDFPPKTSGGEESRNSAPHRNSLHETHQRWQTGHEHCYTDVAEEDKIDTKTTDLFGPWQHPGESDECTRFDFPNHCNAGLRCCTDFWTIR